MKQVSLIIPVFNAARYLRETLENALAQEGVDYEVIVVDDGSMDASPSIIAEYKDRLVIRRQENAGQAVAMNTALTVASGEYIAFLDADDLCLPGRLRTQASYLSEHPGVDLVYTLRENIDTEGRKLGVRPGRKPDSYRLLYLNDIPHSSVMLRRSILDSAGNFDSSYPNHDWDLWVRISEHGQIALIAEPLIQYRIHETNISRTRRRPLNHYRWTRQVMLGKTKQRRQCPWWLTVAHARAVAEWRLLSSPWWSESGGRWWWRVHSVINVVEQGIIRRLAGRSVYPTHD